MNQRQHRTRIGSTRDGLDRAEGATGAQQPGSFGEVELTAADIPAGRDLKPATRREDGSHAFGMVKAIGGGGRELVDRAARLNRDIAPAERTDVSTQLIKVHTPHRR